MRAVTLGGGATGTTMVGGGGQGLRMLRLKGKAQGSDLARWYWVMTTGEPG